MVDLLATFPFSWALTGEFESEESSQTQIL